VINTDHESVEHSLERLYSFVCPRLRPPAG
jgi:hypothetical protein